MKRRLLFVLTLAVLAVACDKDKEVDPPAQLVDLQPRIKVQKVWSTSLGGGADRLRLGLRPASFDGTHLYVADHEGDVLAVQKNSGRVTWRTSTDLPLSGGPGVGFGRVVIGSNDGDLVALSTETGQQLWKVNIGGEVLAAPAVAESIVVVRTVDGRLRGLNAADGAELWMLEQQVPRLSVRGTAAPVIAGDIVICGFDNGKVIAVTLREGDTVWETAIGSSRGRTELERMVDIDAAVDVDDKDVFVVGYQAKAAKLAIESGQIWWARDASSDRGLALNDQAVYLSSASGDVVALSRDDGTPVWEQPALHRRSLTGPVLDGPALVVADFEGYLHWLDARTGELLARQSTDGDRVTNAPLVTDSMVFVLTDSGTLAAFKRADEPIPVRDAPAAEAAPQTPPAEEAAPATPETSAAEPTPPEPTPQESSQDG
jgi:outer membrane protein assembly factor BamB